MSVELTEAFLAKIAGWEAMKSARGLVAADRVSAVTWEPPMLKGVVQEGQSSYRAGLVIKGAIEIENLCTCRQSRQWGMICAHSVAVGVGYLTRRGLGSGAGLGVGAAASGSQRVSGAAMGSAKEGGVGANPRVEAKSAVASVPGLTRTIYGGEAGERGRLATLHIILPPLLGNGAPRGVVMVYFEATTVKGRRPLDTLTREGEWCFDEADSKALDAIESVSGGGAPGFMQVTVADFQRLAVSWVGHPRVTLGKSQAVKVLSSPWAPPIVARLEANGEMVLRGKPGGVKPAIFRGGAGVWVFTGTTLQPMFGGVWISEAAAGLVRLARVDVPIFLSRDWPGLMGLPGMECNFRLEDFRLSPVAPRFVLELLGGLARLQARLQCAYGGRTMTLGVASKEEGLWIPDPSDAKAYSTRDVAAEQAALGRLLRNGFQGPDQQGRYLLSGEEGVLRFLAREYPKLEKEWTVTLEERLERAVGQGVERVDPRFQIVTSGEQWFDLHVSYTTQGGETLPTAEIQRLVRSGQGHTRLRNGKLAILDTGAVEELQEILVDCAPQQHDGAFRVSQAQAGFLDASLRAHEAWKVSAPGAWKERVGKQTGDVELVPSDLGNLKDVLRPYQAAGVGWMEFLRRSGFGGILADEMGLGKTVQTLAFLRVIASELRAGKARGRLVALIVCPTSLVYNWVSEAGRFVPELKVLAINGPQRAAAFATISEHDVVVTSYALLRRDAEKYRGVEFDTLVLDEAQHIKNRQTQNAQSVKAVRGRNRFVLTGTPLENSVFDIWSIFDFLMPGYLGNADHFKERYEIPITREKDAATQARLSKRLRPFMLRRLKRDVVKELPEKIEQVVFCEMSVEQSGIYRQILDAGRREVLEAAGQQGAGKGRIAALNALLRLRQACCDLRLLKLQGYEPKEPSAKVDVFEELLEEIIDGGHRVLVFSQFVSMLTILRERLEASGTAYAYLDGSTTNRGQEVERFQKDTSVPVFLISLKAGGTGLNLTGADTVVHFDPWWNPAVEDQATDRAHRIGQSKLVTSYKLITRGSVEEKILSLQGRKREMIQAMLGGEESLVEALTWDEMQELLSG